MVLGSTVDFVEVHVGRDLAAVFEANCNLFALMILTATAVVDLTRNSHLSACGYSPGCSAEPAFFRKLCIDKSKELVHFFVLLGNRSLLVIR